MNKNKYQEYGFYWSVYGIGVVSVLFLSVAVYLIVRIFDGSWSDYKLPFTLGIIWITLTVVSAMIFSLKEIKKELDKEKNSKP